MKTFLKILAILAGLAVLLTFLIPARYGQFMANVPQYRTARSLQRVVTALKHYQTEYRELPDAFRDGKIETVADNAKLLHLLLGKDEHLNPRGIAFLEVPPVDQDPKTGACIDGWGNPIFVRFNPNLEDLVTSPYPGQPPIGRHIIAWSLGQDGQLAPGPGRGDDVVSWAP